MKNWLEFYREEVLEALSLGNITSNVALHVGIDLEGPTVIDSKIESELTGNNETG